MKSNKNQILLNNKFKMLIVNNKIRMNLIKNKITKFSK